MLLIQFMLLVANISYIYIYIYMENARGSPYSVLLAFSQSYVKNDLRKNKIVVALITGFFRH
jgi:hypothetical protein